MNDRLTFAELIDKIALETGASKKLIHDILTETVSISGEGLERDGQVSVSGLGQFRLKWHEERMGRNPQTGEDLTIPAHSSVHYKPEAELRRYINRKYSHLKPRILKEQAALKESQSEVKQLTEEDTPVITNTYDPVASNIHEKKRPMNWLWFIVPLIIIILALIFWPRQEEPPQPTLESAITGNEDSTKANEANLKNEKDATESPTEKETVASTDSHPAESAPQVQGMGGGSHDISAGDNLWILSEEYYTTTTLWPLIYSDNINRVNDPDVLVLGNTIQIPTIEGRPGSLTQNDLAAAAEGYLEVYLKYKASRKPEAYYYLWVAFQLSGDRLTDSRVEKGDLELVNSIKGSPNVR